MEKDYLNFGLVDTVENLWDYNYELMGTRIARSIDLNLANDNITESEYRSWRNSPPYLIDSLYKAGLEKLSVIFEYKSADGKRMDAIIIGYNHNKEKQIVVVEMKQWSNIYNEYCSDSNIEVYIKKGGVLELTKHPLYQLGYYIKNLKFHHELCENNEFKVDGIAYLHNFKDKSQLFNGNLGNVYKQRYYNKTFTRGESEKSLLIQKLKDIFLNKESVAIAQEFLNGEYTLGKAGIDGIKKVLNKEENAQMIDDQVDISIVVMNELRNYKRDNKSRLIVIKGSPGTGKTVLGLYLIYKYYDKFDENQNNVLFTFARSRTLSQIIHEEANSMVPILDNKNVRNKEFIVIDEAHRLKNIEKELDSYFSGIPKVIVLLQDDKQKILPTENGDYDKFIDYAKSRGYYSVKRDLELKKQKRNQMFSNYVDKLDEFLYTNNNNINLDIKNFDLKLENNINKIDSFLKEKKNLGYKVKWYAPFCWEWSRNVHKNDINIEVNGNVFSKPWNPMNNQYRWYLAEREDDLNQVGCIYTAQGLDFDYTGVIWWNDLKWNKYNQEWEVNQHLIKDPTFKKIIYENKLTNEDIKEYILNSYRILLTRALKGLRIWFLDEDTKNHFEENFNI